MLLVEVQVWVVSPSHGSTLTDNPYYAEGTPRAIGGGGVGSYGLQGGNYQKRILNDLSNDDNYLSMLFGSHSKHFKLVDNNLVVDE